MKCVRQSDINFENSEMLQNVAVIRIKYKMLLKNKQQLLSVISEQEIFSDNMILRIKN